MIRYHSHTEPGGHRENQDAFAVREYPSSSGCYLLALADGQGGRSGAAPAAKEACDSCLVAAVKVAPAKLLSPAEWTNILRTTDRAVAACPEAGFTTLVALYITGQWVCGGSSGDSAAVLLNHGRAPAILTERQEKNPPVGSGNAQFVPFTARLADPWVLLAMSDGVWRYAGWPAVVSALNDFRGDEILTNLRRMAGMTTGALQDDFTAVQFEGG